MNLCQPLISQDEVASTTSFAWFHVLRRQSAVHWRRSFFEVHASVTFRFFFRVLWRRLAILVVCGAQPLPATSIVVDDRAHGSSVAVPPPAHDPSPAATSSFMKQLSRQQRSRSLLLLSWLSASHRRVPLPSQSCTLRAPHTLPPLPCPTPPPTKSLP